MQRYTIFFIIVNVLHISGCVYSFWAPDDGRRNSLKHVQHWQ